MAKKKKKVIVTPKATAATAENLAAFRKKKSSKELVFGKENYKWIGIGVALITVGLILMIGGFNENPAIWDESAIYGFQRTVLAPFVILSGLAVNIYALFK